MAVSVFQTVPRLVTIKIKMNRHSTGGTNANLVTVDVSKLKRSSIDHEIMLRLSFHCGNHLQGCIVWVSIRIIGFINNEKKFLQNYDKKTI